MRATLRFYAELNDFLPPAQRYTDIVHTGAKASVKDVIEAHGVPHAEVDLVLADGEPIDFAHIVADGERIAVYPVFESFDIGGLTRVRPVPLREIRFVLDVHLGRLARYLRLAGFDSLYRRDCDDGDLVKAAVEGRRVLLTRDLGVLKRGEVTHGYFVRETAPARQLREVLGRFDLARQVRPFTRCLVCNGVLAEVRKDAVADLVPPRSREAFDRFLRCPDCRRVYWRGSHAVRLERLLESAAGPVER